MSKKAIKNIFGSIPGRNRKVRSETPPPPMSDMDAAKLRRRKEIRVRVGETTLKQIPESVFAAVTHDYIENGLGDLTKIVILLYEEAWLHTNTHFNAIEASSRHARFARAVDDWLRTRLMAGNWENIGMDEVPISLYQTFVERFHVAWERYAIEVILKNNHELHGHILLEHPDNVPIIEGKIAATLRRFPITRNGRRTNLAAALQDRVGLTDYNAILKRAREDISRYARKRYIMEFQSTKPQAIRIKFDDFFNDLVKNHIPRLAEEEHVHPELLIRAIRRTSWFALDEEE
ncbi:hypothetical protein BJV82DRAFT_669945 [Fennellomyces sp. T-0311]|nr:hypothetical protein BJV82DRAFT_669945 [Fennellomyces sp. T-0311]